jgi:beta-alanine--pyruvate transaminase
VFVKCFRKGAMVRYTDDILAFSPPLIVDETQLVELFSIAAEVLKETE